MIEHSSETSHDEVLQTERGVNERYQRELAALVAKQPDLVRAALTPRSQRWTVGAPHTPVSESIRSPIAGRVALDAQDEMLGEGFYVGSWYRECDGVQVVSWAAPIASLFYEGRLANDVLARSVSGRRTFIPRELDIADFVDDVESGEGDVDPFRATRPTLVVPAAPTVAIARPAAPRADEIVPLTVVPHRPERPEEDHASDRSASRSDAHQETSSADSLAEAFSGQLRAENAVLSAIARPRTGRLNAVLATLQPDQYRFVTWAYEEPLVVQGQPGTGKTIIATHRAAYLVHPERDVAREKRALLVGPTDQYVEHVRGVVAELGESRVEVVSLTGLFLRLTGLRSEPPSTPEDRLDTVGKLGFLLERAARRLRESGLLKGSPSAEAQYVVDALASAGPKVQALADRDPELSNWIHGRTWERASASSRFLPYLAAAVVAVHPPSGRDLVDHLVVDEAQDLRPLEWRVLLSFLRPSGSLSVFGDVNQRRSDWTASSWEDLIEDLELADEDRPVTPQELLTGYRSTQEILRFANRLLPKRERRVHALRSGPSPVTERVPREAVVDSALRHAVALKSRHPDGLVAIITMKPQQVSDRLRKRGWTRSGRRNGWLCDGAEVLVLHPQDARGLEFDGVVVVEPDEFPENVGRLGLLYTSLTRATQELAVVYARPLPKGLETRGGK